ncbi:MAG: cold-shock protein [Planctomycetes bacterium]|nr:cold-shock protein [Planctomycetota bacterium]
MARGTVKWFDPKKGFGFVVNEEGQDVFIHFTSIEKDGFRCLRNGQIVEYEQLAQDKGLHGTNVQIVEAAPKQPPPPPRVKQKAKAHKPSDRRSRPRSRPGSRPRVINGNR